MLARLHIPRGCSLLMNKGSIRLEVILQHLSLTEQLTYLTTALLTGTAARLLLLKVPSVKANLPCCSRMLLWQV